MLGIPLLITKEKEKKDRQISGKVRRGGGGGGGGGSRNNFQILNMIWILFHCYNMRVFHFVCYIFGYGPEEDFEV